MPDILIRNVPDELNVALKVAAVANGVSREAYALSILQNAEEVQAARILLDALEEMDTHDPKAGWYEDLTDRVSITDKEESNDVL